MAIYTVELGTIIENKFDIGLKDYPIYKEEHREQLNKKIIDHFYFREIGLETPELFKRFLNRKMNEIMPYYNQRYKSEDVEFNPLYNIEIKETFERELDSTGSMEQSSEAKENSSASNSGNTNTKTDTHNIGVGVTSDTPQSELSMEDIKNNKYASSTVHNDDDNITNQNINQDGTSSGNVNSETSGNAKNMQNNKETYTKFTEGSSAGLPFSKAIKQWREIMLNIDMEIIEELEPLFMQIY